MKKIILSGLIILNLHTGFSQQWNILPVPYSRNLYSCWFDPAHPDTGMAVGWYLQSFDLLPFAFKTTDGGNTIYNSSLFQIYFYASQDVAFTNSYNGVVVGNGIIQTPDGGNSWNISEDATAMQGGRLFQVKFLNSTDGYAVGERYDINFQLLEGMIYKTSNAGGSWTSHTISQEANNENTSFQTVFPAGNGVVFAGALNIQGNASTLYKSTDDGVTWNALPFYTGIRSIIFTSADTGFMATDAGLYRTADTGNTWISILPTTAALHSVDILDGFGLAAGANGLIFASKNNGLTWLPMISPVTNSIECVRILNQNLAYAVGSNGTFLKYTGSTAIPDNRKSRFQMNSVYLPSQWLHVKWSKPVQDAILLQILDVRGSIVKQINLSGGAGGTVEKFIDLRGIEPGLYVVNCITGNNHFVNKVFVSGASSYQQ